MPINEKYESYLDLRIKELSKHPVTSFPGLISIAALVISITMGVISFIQNDLSTAKQQSQQLKNETMKENARLLTLKTELNNEKILAAETRELLKRELKTAEKATSDKEKIIAELDDLRESMSAGQKEHEQTRADLQSTKDELRAILLNLNDAKSEIQDLENWFLVTAPRAMDTDIVVYNLSSSSTTKKRVEGLLLYKGFDPDFPLRISYPPKDKRASITTIFYYSKDYKEVAESLRKGMNELFDKGVKVKRGSSNLRGNKIIVHLVGGDS